MKSSQSIGKLFAARVTTGLSRSVHPEKWCGESFRAVRELRRRTHLANFVRGVSTERQSAGREHRYVDIAPASAHIDTSPTGVRPIENAPADVLSFGDTSPTGIRNYCQEHVPGWAAVPHEEIYVDQLCEGLSNQNFKVYLNPESQRPGLTPCVLFRVFGKDASTLYDTKSELEIVKLLSNYEIGPTVYAHGDGWRIEGWHFSVALPNRRMRNPSIFVQVASHLGRLHKLSQRSDFPKAISDKPPLSKGRLQDWTGGAKKAAASFKHPETLRKMDSLKLDENSLRRSGSKSL